MIQTFGSLQIAWRHRIHPPIARLALGIGPPPFADGHPRGARGLKLHPPFAVAAAGPEPLQMRDRNARQALITLVPEVVAGSLQ